jgi:sugar phosphate isomerase/epimerase
MKVSLGSWAFSFGPHSEHPITFDDIAKRAAQAGYDGIEVCGFPPHITLEDYPAKADRREVVRLLAELNLGVSGYSPDYSDVNPIVPGNESRYLDLFRRNVEMCVDLGAPVIRVDSGAAPGSIRNRDHQAAFDRLAGVWRQAADIARAARVRMVWEFEPGFVFNKPSEVVEMYERVGHPSFAILFDTSHAYMCGVAGARQHGETETLHGGVAEFLDLLSGRIGHIHLIDSDGTLHGDETSTHRPFGEGLINFPKIAPKLKAVPGIEWWCVDLCFWPDSWQLVESSLAYVRRLLV